MKFIDEVKITVRSGRGGDGAVAWRREKYVAQGGPAGGDGGDGGHVTVIADSQLTTLLDHQLSREQRAENGENGGKKDMNGRRGKSVTLRVPVGTVVYNDETGAVLVDLQSDGQEFIVARGGRGGWGNIHFMSATNRAPQESEPGGPGEEKRLRFELKLLADVGILGFPNVGKSTFISRVSAARPKIADYPFTTLVPNLGVVAWRDYRSFVIADIPGLIPGAHQGAGLGLRFLRHIERTRVILHIIEFSEDQKRDPREDFEVLNRELALYSEELAKRPQVVALNKIDLPHVRDLLSEVTPYFAEKGISLIGISAATGEGLQPLLDRLASFVFQKKETA
jgi:GTP-binding protein